MASSVNAESAENDPSDKGSSIIRKLKKGTQNVFAYRKPSKPGNKLRKRAPTGLMASESAHTAPSVNDKSSQEEQAGASPVHHQTKTSPFQEQNISVNTDKSKSPRPLTPMKAPQGQNRPAERPTYRHPTRLSPVKELDSPVKTEGAERPCSPTPMKASRSNKIDDADTSSPAPLTAVRKPGRFSPVREQESPVNRNYRKNTTAMDRPQKREDAERLEGDRNGDAILPVNADESVSSPIKKNDLAGRKGLFEEEKDTEVGVGQVSSERSRLYDIRTIGKKEGRAISEERQARKAITAEDKQERPVAEAPKSKLSTPVKR
ncbi:hypothetical protein P171DRAFT_487313 [Karstenula rhodostoma CBS 690.94]|uniref:Uncharacterized protein n=1 Tax=Karstenula rhodostoma CBS 690.94 TaxID=1392251 RepID=A0A9P4U892_9PLEO|nr:hypothetical protein P171DRAFT_487313 [Karstenula rhodostoma CBS 690.94]